MTLRKSIFYLGLGLAVLGSVAEHRRDGSGQSASEEATSALGTIVSVTGTPAPDAPGSTPPAQRPAGLEDLSK